MTYYAILKLIHVGTVVVTISLFVYRYARLSRYPDVPLARPLKIIPHINDTLLLAAAILMLVNVGLNPFATPWLAAKLAALLLYIVLGTMCIKAEAGSRRQTLFFVLAVSTFAYILFVALTKQISPF